MWDAVSSEAMYRTEQIRRARGLESDHHRVAARRPRPYRWTARTGTADREAGRR